MPDGSEQDFVHRGVTVVVGNDEQVGLSVIFLVKKEGGLVISFPSAMGTMRKLSAADMELFLASTPESPMVEAIRRTWRKVQPQ